MTLASPTAPDNTPFHSFRVAGGSVVLDLPFRPPPGWSVRAATLWPDSRSAHGWGADHWAAGPGGRGFVPGLTDVGDVLQFAAESPTPQRELTANVWAPPESRDAPQARTVHSWFGYLHGITRTSLIVRGPYQTPEAAYYAAQRALQIDLARTEAAHEPTRPAEPLHPAAPPVAVSLDYHGDTATVGDPYHGWITIPSRDLASALMLPHHELLRHLHRHVPHLNGREPQITLAALAARHLPHQLPDLLAQPRGGAPSEPDASAPATPTPTGPSDATTDGQAPPSATTRSAGPSDERYDMAEAAEAEPPDPRRPAGTSPDQADAPPNHDAALAAARLSPRSPGADPAAETAAGEPGTGDAAADLASTGWTPPDAMPPDSGLEVP
ncbi:hypothetical protein [Parafrankia elaeagni]|uniref:hypothetical protein n=1 Tax=Parafrankia elaeagni TaxID=222534 RepID=UPI0003AAD580|nr:hypothetical protein [Parafrankia elaeagni]